MSISVTELVKRFYDEVWNKKELNVVRQILDPDFRFRGSLGQEKIGQEGFIEYLLSVHTALGNYTCNIEDLIANDDRAAAKMTFKGIHQAPFFGVQATGSEISWAGAAFFKVHNQRITELWVLGDIDSLKQQLKRKV